MIERPNKFSPVLQFVTTKNLIRGGAKGRLQIETDEPIRNPFSSERATELMLTRFLAGTGSQI